MTKAPTYHDLYITTPDIPRTRIADLPFGAVVICTRTGGWELWDGWNDRANCLAGEYDGEGKWLVLDVNGHVIVDGRQEKRDGQ